MQLASVPIIAISLLLALGFNAFIGGKEISNFFLLELFKILIVAFSELISFMLAFCLLLFIYLFFLLDNYLALIKN